MGEDAAKAAASAIEADGWGAGKPGDVQAKCPGKCKTMYRIHPAIGVARVGDSPDEFFIGAETDNYKSPENFCLLDPSPAKGFSELPRTSKADGTRFKDKAYPGAKVRRQAARFRIFEYRLLKNGEWGWAREINSDDAEIKWTVKVANKKATFFEFHANSMAGPKRSGPAVSPPETSFTVKRAFDPAKGDAYARKPLEDSGSAAKFKYLGEILHDEKGRLVFLGGRGGADGPPKIDDYANNSGWSDDVSDGWIKAEIKLADGSVHKTTDSNGDAWVLVGPPDFGPQLTNVVSLYDTMLDVAARSLTAAGGFKPKGPEDRVMWTIHGVEDRAKGTFEPHLEHDLVRFFEATYQVNTVFAPANPPMKHPAVYKLAKNTKLDDAVEDPADVAAGKAPKAAVRYKTFNTLRPWDENRKRDPGDPKIAAGFDPPPATPSGDPPNYEDRYEKYRWTMPFLWSDSDANYTDTRYAVTELIYRMMKKWSAGKFKDTKAADFSVIPRSGIITPGGLDRAALDRAVGGPFFPGIEVSWLVRSDKIYVEPFRVKFGAKPTEITLGAFKSAGVTAAGISVDVGFFSQQMAQPWHADFLACARDDSVPATRMIGWWPAQRPDDVVRGNPAAASAEALQKFKKAKATDSEVTIFEKSGTDTLDGPGKDAHARNITISTRGADAAKAPTEAKITGADEKGNPVTDTIKILRPAGTYAGKELFKKVTKVAFKGVVAPEKTTAELAIGVGKVPKQNVDEPARIDTQKTVESKPREITVFDSSLMVEMHLIPRPILVTLGGVRPEEGPATVTVEGEGADDKPLTEDIHLPSTAGTKRGLKQFKKLIKVTISAGRPKLNDSLEIAIGIGAFVGRMEQWSKGVNSFAENTTKWAQLGFVLDGVEVERDPAL
jgi:hypothetical protein